MLRARRDRGLEIGNPACGFGIVIFGKGRLSHQREGSAKHAIARQRHGGAKDLADLPREFATTRRR